VTPPRLTRLFPEPWKPVCANLLKIADLDTFSTLQKPHRIRLSVWEQDVCQICANLLSGR